MEIYGYRRNVTNQILTWIVILGTFGLLRLVFFWRPHWMLYCTSRRCRLKVAERVLLIDKYNQYFVEQVRHLSGIPHLSELMVQGGFHQPDNDEVLRCPDDSNEAGQFENYGSLVPRSAYSAASRRIRTFSTRSNKSTLTEDSYGLDQDESKPEANPLSDIEAEDRGDRRAADVLSEAKNIEGQTDYGHALVHFSDLGKERSESEVENEARYFENKKIRYIWDDDSNSFVKLRGFDKNVSLNKLRSMTEGLTRIEQQKRQRLFGENAMQVEVQSYFSILFEEVLGPFYIFQIFSCIVWVLDDYLSYGACIIVMSVASLVSGVIETRRNQEQLQEKVESAGYIKVCRGNDSYEEVRTSELVPGDVVAIPTFNTVLQFDAVLINGTVIVNESMLTGESVPITKSPLPFQNSSKQKHQDTYYDEKEHNKHTLFGGTRVMQTRYYGGIYVKALVIRIGYQTTKGELIRSFLFPKPVDFQFNKQIHKFIGVLASLAIIGFTYSVTIKAQQGESLEDILLDALDLITIVVPPALPAAMTIGIIYAQSRLKKKKIYCIAPRSINLSGCIDCMCFDKTGTLTEDNLSFNEVVPVIEEKCAFGRPFDGEAMQSKSKQVERDNYLLLENGQYSPLMVCLASCHSLTIIDRKIVGDPLDLQMFEATGWVLEEPDVDDENKFDLLAPTVVRPPRSKRLSSPEANTYDSSGEYPSSASSSEEDLDNISEATRRCHKDVGILRQFPFSSSLQRMSVITRQFNGDQFIVYSKGAPEKIASLCDPETIPDDFTDVLHGYTQKGFRVIALAYRALRSGLSYARMQRANRQEIEKDLNFLGLLTMSNLLKSETIPVIRTLNEAAIRCIMVTGDNMLTAISVAQECEMISSHDKTVLIQVEKQLKTGDRIKGENVLEAGLVNGFTEDDHRKCLVSNVHDIQSTSNVESEPILSPKPLREPVRPKLTWQFISQESQPEASREHKLIRFKSYADDSKTHLALTGETWDVVMKHYPELVNPICVRGAVFARMAPHQKQQLVEQLQSLEYYVGMCGDGANDSGALRAAHTGISLSDTEASVAAPFTSATANISCAPTLIAEGRAALVTAFGILKYMALYSLIQFCAIMILYTMHTNFTNAEFLFEDLFVITILVTVFGRTGPHGSLDKRAPSNSLLSIEQLASLGIHIALSVFFQIMTLIILWQHPWYEPHSGVKSVGASEESGDEHYAGHDNFAVFVMSSFQCISMAVVFSKGKPYRKSILTNKLLTGSIIVLTIVTVLCVIAAGEPWLSGLDDKALLMPWDFKLLLLALGFTHFIVAFVAERFIVDHVLFRRQDKFLEIFSLKPRVARHSAIERKIQASNWPLMMLRESIS